MALLNDDMQLTVEEQLGFIATVRPDGAPNLSPKGTIAVWDENHLVFAHVRSPGTVENLRSNPKVEVNVVDQLSRAGYRFSGVATVHETGETFRQGVHFYEIRGMPRAAERIRAIVIIEVRSVSPLTSPAYDIGATEAELRQQWRERLLGQPASGTA